MNLRLSFLLLAAITLTGWVIWDMQQEPIVDISLPAERPITPSVTLNDAIPNSFALQHREPDKRNTTMSVLFIEPRQTVQVTPEKAPELPPPPPPKPVAPSVPYSFFGRIKDINGKVVVYLIRDEQLHPITVGNVLQNSYKIESINNAEIILRYLPLDEQQSIPIPKFVN